MDERLEQLIGMYLGDFHHGRLNCAEAVLIAMCDYYDVDMSICPMIATAFGGGMCGLQGVCGVMSGALMVIGLKHGRELGGDRMPAYELGKKLFSWFEQRHGSAVCRDLTLADFTDPAQMAAFRLPGGAHGCVCEPLVAEACRWLADNL